MDIRPIGNTVQTGAGLVDKTAHIPEAATPTKPVVAPVEVPANAVQQPGSVAGLAELTLAVKNINKSLQDRSQDLEFSVDNDNNRTIVKVIDQNTKEILRQIPSEEALEIAKSIDQALQGLLIRQKA